MIRNYASKTNRYELIQCETVNTPIIEKYNIDIKWTSLGQLF